MTRPARLLLLLYLVAFVWLTYWAALDLGRGDTGRGLAVYAGAVVLLAAGGREVHHGGAAQAAAVRDGRPRPHTWPSDRKAVLRAELAENCDCPLWWTSLGTFHNFDCPRITHDVHHEES
ncbi:hypothetical protein [Streptomyces sp. NBC_01233]|uniref:hypothetical protein n=1 Tax=Streptomyces sp. NBC_01233 TaxID=2903787 RepID=UPI002E1524F7|nr:hypothetical protein OG332_24250 [Streptomyces sp. NBC_01233]